MTPLPAPSPVASLAALVSCGRHPANARTVIVKLTRTKLVTRTSTATGVAKNRRSHAEPEDLTLLAAAPRDSESFDDDAHFSEPAVPALFGRHLCPACPKGVTVLSKQKNGNKKGAGGVVYCCPLPMTKTITRVVKTLTRTIIKTITVKKPFVCVKKYVFVPSENSLAITQYFLLGYRPSSSKPRPSTAASMPTSTGTVLTLLESTALM